MRWSRESVPRSLVKTVTFRVLVAAIDFAIIFLFTRRIDLTLGFVAVTTIIRTVIYFVHERIWNNIHWGKTTRKKRW